MDTALIVLVGLIAVALLFDFLNGLHDAANSIATIVSTRALSPRAAVIWAAFFNFIAFLVFGLHVANTVGKGIISPEIINDRVIFGATETLLDEEDKPNRYQIVGMTEADARKGRISYNSPLGKALIGRKVGEDVEVTVPSGDRFYLVDKIEFI